MTLVQKERVTTLRRQGESYSKIAGALGISVNTIQSFCRRNNIAVSLPTTGENHSFCRQCGEALTQQPGKKTKKFCSEVCCDAWWKAHPDQLDKKAVYNFTCVNCGTAFTAYGNKGRKFCSHDCYVACRFGKAVGG